VTVQPPNPNDPISGYPDQRQRPPRVGGHGPNAAFQSYNPEGGDYYEGWIEQRNVAESIAQIYADMYPDQPPTNGDMLVWDVLNDEDVVVTYIDSVTGNTRTSTYKTVDGRWVAVTGLPIPADPNNPQSPAHHPKLDPDLNQVLVWQQPKDEFGQPILGPNGQPLSPRWWPGEGAPAGQRYGDLLTWMPDVVPDGTGGTRTRTPQHGARQGVWVVNNQLPDDLAAPGHAGTQGKLPLPGQSLIWGYPKDANGNDLLPPNNLLDQNAKDPQGNLDPYHQANAHLMTWVPGEGVPPGSGRTGDTMVWDPTPRPGKPHGGWSLLSGYLKPNLIPDAAALDAHKIPDPGVTHGTLGENTFGAGKVFQYTGTGGNLALPDAGGGGSTVAPNQYFWLDQAGKWHTSATEPAGTAPLPGQTLIWVNNYPGDTHGPGQWVPGEGVPPAKTTGSMIEWDPKGGPAGLGGWYSHRTTLIDGTDPDRPGVNPAGTMLIWDPTVILYGPDGVTPTGTKGQWVPYHPEDPDLPAGQKGPFNGQLLVWDTYAGPVNPDPDPVANPTGHFGGWVTRTLQFDAASIDPLSPIWLEGTLHTPAPPTITNLGATLPLPTPPTAAGEPYVIDQPVTPGTQFQKDLPDGALQGDVIKWNGQYFTLPDVGDVYVVGAYTAIHNLAQGLTVAAGDQIQWVGDHWRKLSAQGLGMWAPANPTLKIRWDQQSRNWLADLGVPTGLRGEGLEIEGNIEGGVVGVPDLQHWLDVAKIPAYAATGIPKAWAIFHTANAADVVNVPTPDKIYAPPGVVPKDNELLQWVPRTIDGSRMAVEGGVEGFSYLITVAPPTPQLGDEHGATGPSTVTPPSWAYWTLPGNDPALGAGGLQATGTTMPATPAAGAIYKVDATLVAANPPELPPGTTAGDFIRWDGTKWLIYIPTARWVREAAASKPDGYWEWAQAGRFGALLQGTPATVPLTGKTAFGTPVGGGTGPLPGTLPTGLSALQQEQQNIFNDGILPDPAKILDPQGQQRSFIVVATFWNDNRVTGIPEEYMVLLGYTPPDSGGHYGVTGKYVNGPEVGLGPEARLWLPDGWAFMGTIKGVQGPAGEIIRADAHNVPPVQIAQDWSLGQATVLLGGHPSRRTLDFGVPAGLPASITGIQTVPIGPMEPPQAELHVFDAEANKYILTLYVPRGSDMQPVFLPATGTPGAVAPGVGVMPALTVLTPNGPNPPKNMVPSTAPVAPVTGQTFLLPDPFPTGPGTGTEWWRTITRADGTPPQPGDWIVYDKGNWFAVPAPTPQPPQQAASGANGHNVFVDMGSGQIWQSMPSQVLVPTGALPTSAPMGTTYILQAGTAGGPAGTPVGSLVTWNGLDWVVTTPYVGGYTGGNLPIGTGTPPLGTLVFVDQVPPNWATAPHLTTEPTPAVGDHLIFHLVYNPLTGASEPMWTVVHTPAGGVPSIGSGTNAAPVSPYVWQSVGSIKGDAGTIDLGTITVFDDALLPLLPASAFHADVVNSGTPQSAVLDITLPRATRWWWSPVPPTPVTVTGDLTGANTLLPANPAAGDVYTLTAPIPNAVVTAFTSPGGTPPTFQSGDMIMWDGLEWVQRPAFSLPTVGGQQMTPQPWDYIMDALTGDVYFYTPGQSPGVGKTTLTGVSTPLPNAPVVGVQYLVLNPIPNAVAVAVPGVVSGDSIEIDAGGNWQKSTVAAAAPGGWTNIPVANLRGPRGPQGPGVRFRGEWDNTVLTKDPQRPLEDNPANGGVTDTAPGEPYRPGDIVMYNAIAYMITQIAPTTKPDGTP